MASDEARTGEKSDKRVVMFPAPGLGHFIPMMELAKRLCAYHELSVTVITADWTVPQQFIADYSNRLTFNNNSKKINFRQLPSPKVQHNSEISLFQKWALMEDNSRPLLEEALRCEIRESGGAEISAFISDFFSTAFFEIPPKFQIPIYVFFVSAASFLCLMLHTPIFAEKWQEIVKDPEESPISIPGLPEMQMKDMPDGMRDPSSFRFQWVLGHCVKIRNAHGFLINTCHEMEPLALTTLKQGKVVEDLDDKVYCAVGPLVQSSLLESLPKTHDSEKSTRETTEEKNECVHWLDLQPPKSVLYVCFGSARTLSGEQIRELAHALEASEHRFLWVLQRPQRPPGLVTGTESPDSDPPEMLLPDGFARKIKNSGQGLIFTSWAPQVQILRHPSTGGFVSHCGWNSALEAIVCGVPVLAWPLTSDQKINAFLLEKQLKVALRMTPRSCCSCADGSFLYEYDREEIERSVRQLMTETSVRGNMEKLSCSANAAIASPAGSSFVSLADVAAMWRQRR